MVKSLSITDPSWPLATAPKGILSANQMKIRYYLTI